MEENNKADGAVATETAVSTERVAEPTAAPAKSGAVKKYFLAAVAILVIGVGLVFVLEREGRISTGIFSFIGGDSVVATVNGAEIAQSDFESSFNQLLQMAAAQGASTTDPAVVEQYRTQAIDTLVNGELLRQAALAAGRVASADAISARYSEIETGLGGAEQLTAKMAEFGITESVLRRDIENEILIQGFFDDKFPLGAYEVSDDDISAFYTGLGGETAGLPPLKDVTEQIAEQIKLDRQQAEISEFIDALRAEGAIEILI